AVISCDKGYIEIMEYPRAQKATIVYTETGATEIIEIGDTKDALYYEMLDMEKAISGESKLTRLEITKEVMDIMTNLRKEWGLVYPEERENKIN
ncbi:MAG: Gfo/Idh/MocA family protein, partial [Cetobacterium sp.]